ncbi:LLM class flavin-dependent oxidoreductase [Hymenobacter sp. ASUV-10]|uniref:LLM class flavin-dependent oxidoreductase n=1 Tax=Hymenobacter aranciens TaxID=3063996 RepID=A0ABT9BHA9_9BACT|nr:LLM class flavin-dependent oxidoreductase [Hymenobacter sp. ASUV-10]MDO7875908.1 LLM class flavin-dependent oxidoreductase [Hymenobacter sp. ASUV-10]
MPATSPVTFSVLDLAPIAAGTTPADTFRKSLDLAQHVEKLGYTRYWLSEHHNMVSVASAAPVVLIGYIAGGTSTLRVGSGGIMLPNHAPLVVAEQLGTLASLYPGRIDLGLGRAPGTDQATAAAIRGGRFGNPHDFPRDIQQLQAYFSSDNSSSIVRAIPGEGLEVPIWILGSSTDSAHLAASLGLPYAFASHFAPGQLLPALDIYRRNFRPSATLAEPYVLACVNVVGADTDAQAEHLSTSLKQFMLGVVKGKPAPLPPPVDSMDGLWDYAQQQYVEQMLAYSFIGGPATLAHELQQFLELTQADELMAVTNVFSHEARVHSYEVLAEVLRGLPKPVEQLAV